MARFKLTYFDMDGGRGEPIRIAFHKAGIEFDDNRFSFPEFPTIKPLTPFGCVPVLEIDGSHVVSQSNALGRYVGKMAGLYPEDNLQALYCDEVCDAVEDVYHYMGPTMGLQGEELLKARQQFVDGRLTTCLKGLSLLLERAGNQYFADKQLTMADLKVLSLTQSLTAGFLDHIPADIVANIAPNLVEHQKLISASPCVQAYYQSRS